MDDKLCFLAVEFPEDENVVGIKYWYLCPFPNAETGDRVFAPLGRHNRIQSGVIREVRREYEHNAPYPLYLIKSVKKIVKNQSEQSDV